MDDKNFLPDNSYTVQCGGGSSKIRKFDKMKTQDDLLEHYWGVIVPMSRKYNETHKNYANPSAKVFPWECVKFENKLIDVHGHPGFLDRTENYTFAIAIVEDKPVFSGDILCDKKSGNQYIVTDYFPDKINFDKLSWTRKHKKRTFMLNGAELPSPINDHDFFNSYSLTINGHQFYFANEEHRNVVSRRLTTILAESRDKE